MFEKSVLIISYPDDLHAQHLQKILEERKVCCSIINFGQYPESFTSSLLFNLESEFDQTIMFENHQKPVETVTGIWWRRPLGAYGPEKQSMDEKYIASEAESYIRALPNLLPEKITWVSDPEATRIASRKPLQLRIAQTVGFKVPKTCVGNSKKAVLHFLKQTGFNTLVAKPVGNGFLRRSTDANDPHQLNQIIYAKRITSSFLKNHIDHVTTCPFILQEEIKNKKDIRVTVVGDNVFAVSISSPSRNNEEIDWRHHSLKRSYDCHNLPSEVVEKCKKVTYRLGLRFGCIDLALSEGEYVFLEINPQGQWLPSETEIGHPISKCLVSLLVDQLED